ncbi:MAG: hypothetical protein SWX82_32820 [Cyanobacteriota bacterium]|nr:hypothetical protein [Cyanobacteriota bacterium]MDY7008577.1 hypothetical protein [Cyanobacteriota bacterium]MDY7008578.1 hypothetical protein [Cyanobacteriota bacterium]
MNSQIFWDGEFRGRYLRLFYIHSIENIPSDISWIKTAIAQL